MVAVPSSQERGFLVGRWQGLELTRTRRIVECCGVDVATSVASSSAPRYRYLAAAWCYRSVGNDFGVRDQGCRLLLGTTIFRISRPRRTPTGSAVPRVRSRYFQA